MVSRSHLLATLLVLGLTLSLFGPFAESAAVGIRIPWGSIGSFSRGFSGRGGGGGGSMPRSSHSAGQFVPTGDGLWTKDKNGQYEYIDRRKATKPAYTYGFRGTKLV